MKGHVLVVEDDRLISRLITDVLTGDGYYVLPVAYDCTEAMSLLNLEVPDVILLDVELPDLNGVEFCRILRNDTRTGHLPIIMLTSRSNTTDKVAGLEAGADDYMVKPFEKAELLARIKTQLRRAKGEKLFNPLTGLPGNKLILDRINHLLKNLGAELAICYVDLDNFKAYNDYYGFLKGDQVLQLVADILQREIRQNGSQQDFLGHIGGDDFIFITTISKTGEICQGIIKEFELAIPLFYNAEDRANGYMWGRDRQNREQRFPLMSISIAVVTNEHRNFTNAMEVAAYAAELKKKAKAIQGNAIVLEP